MINRPTKSKVAEHDKTTSDIQIFLEGGGCIEHLPGFGMRPTMETFDPNVTKQSVHNLRMGVKYVG